MTSVGSSKRWWALEITIDREVEEVISSALWEDGTLGIVTAAENPQSITLFAYFDKSPNTVTQRARLEQTLLQFGHATTQLHAVVLQEVPDEDWLKRWKEGYQPFCVGERFLITPSWARTQLDTNLDRFIIQIDPGMAFGTGTHETTRLCLEALERYWQGGRLLDVGTGTGILTIAATQLHPQSDIVACDNDPEAIEVAKENLAINGVADTVKLVVASAANYRGGKFSLVVANLTADVIIILLDDLIACLAEGGRLILSGILDTQQQQVLAALDEYNCHVIEITSAGEWIAIIVE
ncbi:MAG: 50S ribosomal protein L11 methyltransferase [Acidobacteriota bacterium]